MSLYDIVLYILAILKKSHCDITENLWCHRCALRYWCQQTTRISCIQTKHSLELWLRSESSESNSSVLDSNVSNMRSTTQNCKISYSALTNSKHGSKTAAMNPPALWLMTSERNAYTQDTSLKWLQKCSCTFQEGSYFKKSSYLKQNFNLYLKAIIPVNPENFEFCGYTMLNTFASQKLISWQRLGVKSGDYPHNNFHLDTSTSRAQLCWDDCWHTGKN